MDRGRVGEDRESKETDGCPLTVALYASIMVYHFTHCEWKTLHFSFSYWNWAVESESLHSTSKFLCFASLMMCVPARISSLSFQLAVAAWLTPTV
jgi:hypothetical protein